MFWRNNLLVPKKTRNFKAFHNHHHMRDERTYYRQLKSEHFIAAVNRVFRKSKQVLPFHVICRIASEQPAPQFYISPRHALQQHNHFKRTGTIDAKDPVTEQMYRDIFRLFDERLAKNADCFRLAAMQDILDRPAPSFYLHDKSAIKYYYAAMADRRMRAKQKRESR